MKCPSVRDLQRWTAGARAFSYPSPWFSLLQLGSNLALLATLYAVMWKLSFVAPAAVALLWLPAGGLLVRIFIVQHDCGHRSFFPGRRANDLVGFLLGLLTLTPYTQWRLAHASHHIGAGRLNHRGPGEVREHTVREYLALGRTARLSYRLYRHPAVLFLLAPAYLFLVRWRLPWTRPWSRRTWLSVLGCNVVLAGAVVAAASRGALRHLVAVHVPPVVVMATIGVWLFYVQHYFERTARVHDSRLPRLAALLSSSYYHLPPVLRWFTGNIGYHTVHHLFAGIPNYRLPSFVATFPEFKAINRITLRSSFAATRLALWDERQERMISFADLDVRCGRRVFTLDCWSQRSLSRAGHRRVAQKISEPHVRDHASATRKALRIRS